MGNIRRGVRKGIVLALSAAMTLGLTSTFMGESNEVAAANTSGNPEGWLTKADLMTGDTSGNMKVYFGKDENGNAQAWYVLGKDSGISVDNTVLYSEGAFQRNIAYDATTSEKQYDASMGTYEDGSAPTSVYAVHYGASDVRKTLRTLAGDTSRFTSAEQQLLNDTTISTWDNKNKKYYTTTDKLYLPNLYYAVDQFGADLKKNTWYLGSQSNIEVAGAINSDEGSYLSRTPIIKDTPVLQRDDTTQITAYNCFDDGRSYSVNRDVKDVSRVNVATNLKLTDALFAVPVESGTPGSSSASDLITVDTSTPSIVRYDAHAAGYLKNDTVSYNSVSGKLAFDYPTSGTTVCVYGRLKTTGKMAYYRTYINSIQYDGQLDQFDFEAPIKIWLEHDVDGITYATNPDETKDTAVNYKITEGANSTWTKDSGKTLTITGDGAYADFTEVRVDGSAIASSNYDDKEGSTVITLKADYLNTLSEGSHTFEIYWKDGKASTTFTVAAASVNPNPGTNPGGDNQNPGGDNQNPGGDNTGNNGNNGSNGGDNSGNTGANTGANANNGTTIGDNNTWDKNTNTDLVVKPGNTIKEVTEVKIDGTTLDSKDYTLGSDGNITISKDYLKKLTNGNHTLQILGKGANGESLTISAGFVVKNSNALAPKTGETFLPYLWLASVAVMLSVLASIVYDLVKAGRKRRA